LPTTGADRLAGVMGWPVHHSLSPLLHAHWFGRYGLAGTYVALPVAPADLSLAFQALPRLGFKGWNVTIPHKQMAARLVDRCDAPASRLGAVNTVLVQDDGTLEGRNTDGDGFLRNLRQQAPDWAAEQGPAVLLGAGGAARGVGGALLAAGLRRLRIVNRTRASAIELARDLQRHHPAAEITVDDWTARAASLAEARLLVQCTSLGMAGQAPLDLSLDALPDRAVVADLVYVPLETPLLALARSRGNAVVDGLGMLLHQAVPGFAHWGGIVPVVDAAARAVLVAALAGREVASR
jgi:shikimate dehydrogenase